MTVIRPPPGAFLCFCGAPVVCQLPHLLCRPHAIAFYQSLVETGAALAWLTRTVPIDVLRWFPLPETVRTAAPDYWYPSPRRRMCRMPDCREPRSTPTGKLCASHLAEIRTANAHYGVLARSQQRALKGV